MRWGVLLAVLSIGASACAPDPQPDVASGSLAEERWRIDAVDHAGAFGTITIDRGDVIPLPPAVLPDSLIPNATHGLLVHVAYDLRRANDSGIGSFDWGARTATDPQGADGRFRVARLKSNADWPVGPSLGMLLPGNARSLSGWFYIAVSAQDLEEPIFLQYQPLVTPVGGGSEPKLIEEIQIHSP